LVGERSGVLAVLGEPVLVLPDWPTGLGKLGGRVSCRSGTIKVGPIKFPGGSGLLGFGASPEEIVMGDEFRILAEMSPDAPHPDFYSGFEFVASDGPMWQVSGVRRTLPCPPVGVTIMPGSAGLLITWPSENSRLQGAENVSGPWFDLGVESPVALAPGHPARFFRL